MKHLGMSLVGWYHSHPYSQPEPSIRDLDCQMSYQLKMKGAKSTYFPCVGIINCKNCLFVVVGVFFKKIRYLLIN